MAYHSNGYVGDDHAADQQHSNGDDGGGKSTYLMEHLATFTVNKETGITYPADGMRRLLQLEKTNGIWSQKMQLRLDRTWVLIMDYETGTVMERFPGKSIIEPTAFTSHNPMEMYNNILVFIVTNSNPQHPPEMHIFQCQSVSAQELVEDLKEMQKGRMLTSRHRRSSGEAVKTTSTPPPPPPAAPPQRAESEQSELTANNDDASSTSSEQYERDVTVLNHCFDDIEKFIARLQHAAAASRELERRRRTRKSKKSDNGDGMLTMRTRPPLDKEFVDIFQKFKLSFNLLAKLKAHIHDPNAPELVHFLFTPLALIVEAAHDTYFELHVPHNVVAPLLTREAINLLINCVTSKETELWQSLGNAWIIPRNEWKGHVGSYHPVFLDKWSPDYPVVDELEPSSGGGGGGTRDGHYSDYNDDYEPSGPPENIMFAMEGGKGGGQADHHTEQRDHHHHHAPISGARSDISADSIERNGGGGGGGGAAVPDEHSFKRIQENFVDMLHKKNAQIVQVTYPRTANNDKELTVVRGEYLELLDDTRKWWRARNYKGDVAHVPHTIVSKCNYQTDIYNNPIYGPQYHRTRPESSSDRFSEAASPAGGDHHHHHPAGVPPPPMAADLVRRERLETPPPPPMPEPQLTPARPPLERVSRPPSSNRPMSSTQPGNVQDELKAIFDLMKLTKREDMEIKTTPEVYISARSDAAEVQDWLQAKAFSTEIVNAFQGHTGKDLFKMAQQHLALFSTVEGKRLQSQLKLQMSVCGYQTVRLSELKNVLEKVRAKSDS